MPDLPGKPLVNETLRLGDDVQWTLAARKVPHRGRVERFLDGGWVEVRDARGALWTLRFLGVKKVAA